MTHLYLSQSACYTSEFCIGRLLLQGVVTTIPAVLTPVTGGFDPVPLRILQKVGSHLCVL